MNSTNILYQCRLCLKRTPSKVNILGGDFPKMLEILTSIKVRENDGLPKYSCPKCAQEVKMALIIKKRIIKAHRLLVDSLKNKRVASVERRIVEVYSTENSSIKLLNVQPDRNKKIVMQASPNHYKNSNRTNVSVQKPIEFIDVDSPCPNVSQAKDPINIIKNLESSCQEVTLTLNKAANKSHTEEASLQRVIDEVMVSVNKNLTCETCNISFKERASYNLHRAKHRKTKCQICGHSVRTDNFKKHLMLHESGPTSCNICGATCKNIESLRGHIFYQHKSAANEYVCEECGKHFRIKYKFELHKKKEHTGIRSFKCETCGKAFFTNGNLISHVNMTHKKLRPHICEFCGTGFSSSYALKTHKRQHTNEKPFKCEFCEEGFRQKVSMRSHLKSKHNVEEAKEHFCKDCEKGFATNYALSIHARLHMAQKCEVCSETFAEKEYLTNHLKEAHNIIFENSAESAQEEIVTSSSIE